MSFEVLLHGLAAGFVASIGLGPVTIMCIQRTLSKPFPSGLVSGVGSAAGDTVFAVSALFFVAVVTPFLEANLKTIKIASGICILIVGLVFFFRNLTKQIRRDRAGKTGLWQDFLSSLAMTLSNPSIVLWQLVVFSAVGVGTGIGTGSSRWSGALVIVGYFFGATLWWRLLTALVGGIRGRFNMRHLVWINKGASAVIIAYGVGTIISGLI